MALQPFNGKEPHPFLWAGSLLACEKKILVYLGPKIIVIFTVSTKTRNVAVGRIVDPDEPRRRGVLSLFISPGDSPNR